MICPFINNIINQKNLTNIILIVKNYKDSLGQKYAKLQCPKGCFRFKSAVTFLSGGDLSTCKKAGAVDLAIQGKRVDTSG